MRFHNFLKEASSQRLEHRQGAANDPLDRRLTLSSPVSICVFCVFCGSIFLVYCRHNLANSLTPAEGRDRRPNIPQCRLRCRKQQDVEAGTSPAIGADGTVLRPCSRECPPPSAHPSSRLNRSRPRNRPRQVSGRCRILAGELVRPRRDRPGATPAHQVTPEGAE